MPHLHYNRRSSSSSSAGPPTSRSASRPSSVGASSDTTDLDAFRGLDGLEVAVRVAVASPEAPSGLAEAADLVVGSPAELLDLLREL